MRISLNGHLYVGCGATFGIRRRRDGRTWKKDSMHSPNNKMCDFYCSLGYIPLGILAQKGLCRNRLGEKENTKIITTFRIILPMSSSDMTQNNWWGLHQSTIISITHLFWVCWLWALHLVPRWRSPSEERQGCCRGSCCCCSCSCCCCFCCIIRFQWQNIWSMNMYMYTVQCTCTWPLTMGNFCYCCRLISLKSFPSSPCPLV